MTFIELKPACECSHLAGYHILLQSEETTVLGYLSTPKEKREIKIQLGPAYSRISTGEVKAGGKDVCLLRYDNR